MYEIAAQLAAEGSTDACYINRISTILQLSYTVAELGVSEANAGSPEPVA